MGSYFVKMGSENRKEITEQKSNWIIKMYNETKWSEEIRKKTGLESVKALKAVQWEGPSVCDRKDLWKTCFKPGVKEQ